MFEGIGRYHSVLGLTSTLTLNALVAILNRLSTPTDTDVAVVRDLSQ